MAAAPVLTGAFCFRPDSGLARYVTDGAFTRSQHTFNGINNRLRLRIDFDINPRAQLFLTQRRTLQRFRDQMHAKARWRDFADRQADAVNADKPLIQDPEL